jgi:RsiW-degrading membrane proteinase PrsW (M82 family)
MDPTLALTGALPALAAMWYFDRLDAKRPEPRWTLRKVSIAGALSTVPVVIVAYMLMPLAPALFTYERALFDSFVVAAGVEELAKLFVVYWLVWHKPEFDERLDGIVYAARAGLGFALVENMLYLLAAEDLAGFAITYGLRALFAVPGHAIWAGIMGYYAARRRFDRTGPGLLGGYLIAVFLHGAYDAAIFLGPPLYIRGFHTLPYALWTLIPIIIVGGGLALRVMARKALIADDAAEARVRLPEVRVY